MGCISLLAKCFLTEHHAMKAYWGSGIKAPCILDLGTRWRCVVIFMPQPLYPQGKSPWYTLDRRLDGPQSQSGHGGEEKNSQPLPGFKPLIIQPVVQCYTSELSWHHLITSRHKKQLWLHVEISYYLG
jgi:hypothetical protein